MFHPKTSLCLYLPGDPHAAQAAVWGAVQSEPSHRQAHLLRHLDAVPRGEGMTAQINRFIFQVSFFLIHLIGSSPPPPDLERVVRPLCNPLLREAELRPRSEHDRRPRQAVLCGGAAARGPGAPHRRDPPSRAQPARHRQEPPGPALLRRSPQTGPGQSWFCRPLMDSSSDKTIQTIQLL